jgi:hypothetical protein
MGIDGKTASNSRLFFTSNIVIIMTFI